MSALIELSFRIESAEVVPFSATPLIALRLHIATKRAVQAMALRSQVQIEAPRRNYSPAEQAQLDELFGEPARWGDTLRPLLWTHATTLVPAFDDSVVVDLQLACSFDFSLAAAKYFHALSAGEVPLLILFSGTVFHAAEGGTLRVAPIPWSTEARFRMPVRVLHELREHYYPNSASLLLRKDVFERLRRFKIARGLATWEQAIESLLGASASSVEVP